MKITKEKIQLIKAVVTKRRKANDEEFLKGLVRVDLTHEQDLRHRIKIPQSKAREFVFYSDEPEERGGTNAGPNPLSYFIAGALSCLMNQYVRLAVAEAITIDGLQAAAKAHFERKIKGAFTRIIYNIRIESSEDVTKVKALAQKAEDYCYAHNTLLKAVEIRTNLYLNDQLVLTWKRP
ncbi:MAG: OsmC family protein [Acidobacteria bacterium]|nr:OsmC family protein [Acidobacteriota bacterium]